MVGPLEAFTVPPLLTRVEIAIAIGALIRLERERRPSRNFAGLRTMALLCAGGPVSRSFASRCGARSSASSRRLRWCWLPCWVCWSAWSFSARRPPPSSPRVPSPSTWASGWSWSVSLPVSSRKWVFSRSPTEPCDTAPRSRWVWSDPPNLRRCWSARRRSHSVRQFLRVSCWRRLPVS